MGSPDRHHFRGDRRPAVARRMKIAIIDSGIHPGHPHVGEIAGGVEITLAGEGQDTIDR
jgi:hypothetical protein